MKKLFVMGLAAIMVMGAAASAMAATSNTQWYVNMRASSELGTAQTPTSASSGGTAKFGTKTGTEQWIAVPSGAQDWTLPEVHYLNGIAGKTATEADRIYTVAPTYSATVDPTLVAGGLSWKFSVSLSTNGATRLSLWNPSAATADIKPFATSGFNVSLYKTSAAGVRTGLLDTVDPAQNGAYTSGVFSGKIYNYKLTDGATAGNGLQYFELFAGAPVVTPEPGSIVAMFSGLVGMAGFAIRRRK